MQLIFKPGKVGELGTFWMSPSTLWLLRQLHVFSAAAVTVCTGPTAYLQDKGLRAAYRAVFLKAPFLGMTETEEVLRVLTDGWHTFSDPPPSLMKQ